MCPTCNDTFCPGCDTYAPCEGCGYATAVYDLAHQDGLCDYCHATPTCDHCGDRRHDLDGDDLCPACAGVAFLGQDEVFSAVCDARRDAWVDALEADDMPGEWRSPVIVAVAS